jgi:ribosomal protein S18 acetylase RimI-like enzyme
MFLIAEDDEGHVVGSALAGYDGHRGWIHYLAVAASHRGTGLGTELVRRAESMLAALGCPKVQLQVRPENAGVIEFYERLGYATYQAVSMGKRLESDEIDL